MKGYIRSVKRPKRANDALYGCKKKSKKRSGFVGLQSKTAYLKQLNEMQSCQLGK